MANSPTPPYRIAPHGARFVQINDLWLNTETIESISKPGADCVNIRTVSGDVIRVEGVYSIDALFTGILGKRLDEPVDH